MKSSPSLQEPLKRVGLRVETPCEEDRNRVQEIQNKLASGESAIEHVPFSSKLISKSSHLDAVVLACT